MKTKFEYYALHYLNQWLRSEKELHEKLQSNQKQKKLFALQAGGAFFGIARSLLTEYEKQNNVERYEPVLKAIEIYSLSSCSLSNVSKEVEKVHNILSQFYGNRTVISATTKFLWLKYREPFVILDSQAKSALGIKGNNYETFLTAWIKEYSTVKNQIADACRKLPSVSRFVIDSSAEIQYLSQQDWFHQRVFDCYLWHKG